MIPVRGSPLRRPTVDGGRVGLSPNRGPLQATKTESKTGLEGVLLAVPTLNEEDGLPIVLAQARELGVDTVVVDGGSTDGTKGVAERFGVPVVAASRGKGSAWRDFLTVVPYSNWKYVAMVDGDATYDLSALPRLVSTDADMVVALRIAVGETPLVRSLGARGLSMLAGFLLRSDCPDLLSGFRVMRSESLNAMQLTSNQFGLETELTTLVAHGSYYLQMQVWQHGHGVDQHVQPLLGPQVRDEEHPIVGSLEPRDPEAPMIDSWRHQVHPSVLRDQGVRRRQAVDELTMRRNHCPRPRDCALE